MDTPTSKCILYFTLVQVIAAHVMVPAKIGMVWVVTVTTRTPAVIVVPVSIVLNGKILKSKETTQELYTFNKYERINVKNRVKLLQCKINNLVQHEQRKTHNFARLNNSFEKCFKTHTCTCLDMGWYSFIYVLCFRGTFEPSTSTSTLCYPCTH